MNEFILNEFTINSFSLNSFKVNLFSNTVYMTKVKKTKKPKAKKVQKKVGKKSVSSGIVGSARVEKIDRRLRPTPPPKLVKIDPMLYNPLKISDNQRSRLISDVPIRMFSGQETANLNRQFDILTSKEKQAEQKIADLEKYSLRNEINANLKDLNDKIDKLNNDPNKTMEEIKKLQEKLKIINRTIPKEDTSLMILYESLNERLDDIFEDLINDEHDDFAKDYGKDFIGDKYVYTPRINLSEVKSSNTLLDDKIIKNSLVDEAGIIANEIKSRRQAQSSDSESDFSVDSLDDN